jgi:hypothetical protein
MQNININKICNKSNVVGEKNNNLCVMPDLLANLQKK